MRGIEPLTSSLPRMRSTSELHRLDPFGRSGRRDSNSRHSAWKADALPTELLPLVCGGNRIRTYSVRDNRFTVCPGSPTPAYPLENSLVGVRAGGGIRTPDPLITNQLLWPTELHRPLSKNKGTKKALPDFGRANVVQKSLAAMAQINLNFRNS